MLPRRELLQGSPHAAELEPLIAAAEQALRTWEPVWSGFLEAPIREEAEQRLGALSELVLASEGGYPGAERRRLLLRRSDAVAAGGAEAAGLQGLELAGNFLFDPARAEDFRRGLASAGARPEEVGDLWLRGDRGAQAIVTAELAVRLDGGSGLVRTVEVRFGSRPIEDLQLPASRAPRALTTVEASLRLDAVASAGFGLSRSRLSDLIRQGAMRVGWQPVLSPSREVAVGERLQLEGKGELVVLAIERTQRGRFRIHLERR